ncbi:MarR family winged helix-turn-helix transcriptional regulator [Companilactobacillus bobalius]|uniref:Transcriptional regulator n=2 Tax=Companilactobacillus bobalius TaxID=2801451 RepID=A0A0R1KHF0_9LACO|nr:MarR family transcriptional regulator [Companilactobacillus bobalius]KRK82827.1 transcriptional regulator [Companilactobacillus bobalius DSM 19674]OVE99493.1 putative HTH-type transcriptional regulator YxaD [Companilactobacillus bobalius]GEO57473.1 MarR family transcriptional regulator [Companilactobacillus paralimentarius]
MDNQLIESLVSIVSFFNRTDRDQAFIKQAGVDLEAVSFQLFVTIGRMQPTNVSDLANLLGKSHSSVSRQIDKLERKQLVTTKDGEQDARVRSIVLSESGEKLKKILDQTRVEMIDSALKDWSEDEKRALLDNLDHLAKTLKEIK